MICKEKERLYVCDKCGKKGVLIPKNIVYIQTADPQESMKHCMTICDNCYRKLLGKSFLDLNKNDELGLGNIEDLITASSENEAKFWM